MSAEMVNLCFNLVTQAVMYTTFTGINFVTITYTISSISHFYPQFPLANIYTVIVACWSENSIGIADFSNFHPGLIQGTTIAVYTDTNDGIVAPWLYDTLRDRGLNDALTALSNFRR